MDASLWMERIPFKETRPYVRRVLAYATIFDWRLEQPVTRLVQPAANRQTAVLIDC